MNLEKAKTVVKLYIINNFNLQEDFEVQIIWQCKIFQNWKFIMNSTIEDGRYYELIYVSDKNEYYLNVYKKEDSMTVSSYKIGEK